MVVYYPEMVRRKKVMKIVLEDLSTIYIDALGLMVLIYKNTCTETEWRKLGVNKDVDFFSEDFYQIIKKIDIYKKADTVFCKKEEPFDLIEWFEYLNEVLEDIHKRTNSILEKYLFYSDDDLIECIRNFMNNILITSYLGLPSTEMSMNYTGLNNTMHFMTIPLYMTLNDVKGRKRTPIFDGVNISLVESYVESLMKITNYLENVKGYSDDAIKQYVLDMECGQVGIARVG